ncbi:MAG: flotillin-like protein FloA [Phycisphaerales bacterium]
MNPLLWILVGVAALVLFVLFVVLFSYFSLWFQALLSKANVGLLSIVAMRFRKVNSTVIVINKIRLVKAGITGIDTDDLENHYLAGGNVGNVVSAIIAAANARIELDWGVATAIDLAGRDILDAVNTSVNPKVIDCPDPRLGRGTIDAVAKDGIQLKARARVTVRTNLARLVGGATEETIVARVGEGIVSSIGSADTHKVVLENPDGISKAVLARGLDSGTAYEILSIDIADIDVGVNIGAKLQEDQAQADMKVAQAKAEQQRAHAVAKEQEYKAEAQKNQALVVLAEADIPKAMAEAFRSGNLGIMDFYRMKNIESDTDMRDSIADDKS